MQRSPEIEMLPTASGGRGQGSSVQSVRCVCVCVHRARELEACGVDSGDWVELGDAALAGGVKAL